MSQLLCPWEAPTYFFFSSNVPHLLYYSHVPALVMAMVLAGLIIFSNRKVLANQLLVSMFLFFCLWDVIDLVLWATNRTDITMLFWSVQILVEVLIYLFSFYLVYSYSTRTAPTFRLNMLIGILLLPFFIIVPTSFNLIGVNVSDCVAVESDFVIYYSYFLEILFTICVVAILVREIYHQRTNFQRRKELMLLLVGALFFLSALAFGNIIGSFGGESVDWDISQYGLFGMPIFIGFLTYLAVKFKAFSVKLFATQALVFAIFVLIASQFAFIRNNTNRILTAVTLVLVTIVGYLLVRSVKKEIQAREEIAKLADDLKRTNINLDNANDNLKSKNDALDVANARLKELDQQKTDFLSIAAHQLRTPLSISKGYLELLEDGGYGKPPKDMLPIFSNMDEANERLIKMIDGFLDVSRIEQGRTKFDFKVESLSDIITEAVNELKPRAADKGLELVWVPDNKLKTDANLDHEKIRHVIFNFIDNAIKYSDKGKITVTIKKDDLGLQVDVVDEGLGFGKEDDGKFFQRYTRGQNVKGINVTGTGIGLFVCRKFVEEHKGKVWSKSKGIGKGSDFGFWVPIK